MITKADIQLRLEWLFDAMVAHFRRTWLTWVLFMLALFLFAQNYKFGANISESLPHKVYLIEKGRLPERGEFIAYRSSKPGLYPSFITFVKHVAAAEGDVISAEGKTFMVNGIPVAEAKEYSSSGRRLKPLELPPGGRKLNYGEFFVLTPHPKSYDSRYEEIGVITHERTVGKAIPVL